MTWHRIDYGNGWSRGRSRFDRPSYVPQPRMSDDELAGDVGEEAEAERELRARQRACKHETCCEVLYVCSCGGHRMCVNCGARKDEP